MITKKTKRRKSYPAILFSFFSVIFVFGIVGFLIFSNWKTNQQRKEFNLRIEFLQQEISVLSEKKQELEALASQLGREEYLEKVAREQLNLQKSDEKVVAILSPEEEENKETQKKKSFWQRILEKISF
ncbi:MAG TPA: hypothetical protein ENI19_01655 [Candidatus Nealsonbacteria bacterium]|uniref:Cell division protein FtsL n=1 Tax=marine sediment metagenome TaxID=412755 RepID=A0A0F9XN24_9ZZZZ|nr:hypothetical protein [Candidatus Nealsonbacteria bacterium]HEB46398.1 hypothetical protein [Candidatus Nealsonbacteria bacterium]